MEGTKLLIVLLATAGVLCAEAATEGEKAFECGAGELLFEGSCWWDDDDGLYSWAEAEDVCKGRNMSLASIHSETEKVFVFALAEGINCWLGLSDVASEGHWQWSDGTPVDYLNWAEGQPDGGDAWDCVYTEGSTGEWQDIYCDAPAGVVCRRQPRCGEGQTLFAGSCWFRRDSWTYTWSEAEDACRFYGLTLASIHSQQEQDFVTDLTGGRQSWIGLTDAATEGEWQWSDGTPADYLNWREGEPSGGDAWDCVATYPYTREWMDYPCDSILGGLVCRGQPY